MSRDLTDPAARRRSLQDDLRAAANAALQVESKPQGGAYSVNPTVVQDRTSPEWLRAEVERVPYLARALVVVANTSAMAARRLADLLERNADVETHLGDLARRHQVTAEAVRTLAHALAELRRDHTLQVQQHRVDVARLRRALDALMIVAVAGIGLGVFAVGMVVIALWF